MRQVVRKALPTRVVRKALLAPVVRKALISGSTWRSTLPPPIEWMNLAFPARIDWATVISGFPNIGGHSSFGYSEDYGELAKWYLTVMCPWELWLDDRMVMSDKTQDVWCDDPLLGMLGGRFLLGVTAEREDGHMPVFTFSGGYRLVIDTEDYGDPYGELYLVATRGSFWYAR